MRQAPASEARLYCFECTRAFRVRDAIGKYPDTYTEPYRYIDHVPTRNSAIAVDVVDTRASLLSAEKLIRGDKYVFIRNAYLQNREFKVKDGEVKDDF